MKDPVTVYDGKYTFFTDEDGLLNCLRHGEHWPAFRENEDHHKGCYLALYHHALELHTKAERYDLLLSRIKYLPDQKLIFRLLGTPQIED